MNVKTQLIKFLRKLCYAGSLAAFVFSSYAQAVSGRTTYQAKIYKPDGLPLENPIVNFRFTVLDPSASCVLYIEDYAAVNMVGSAGLISLTLGMGAKAFPVSGPVTFANVFDNATPSFNCQTPGVYNPVPTDNRKIVMQFNDGNGWQTLPAMAINAVPYAMYAGKSDNTLLLNGKADTSFVEYATLAALNCANDEAIKFNGVSFSCIQVGSAGSVTSSTVVTALGYTPADGASVTALTANVFSVSSTLTTLESSVTSLSSTVAASFAAITSSQWTNVASGISYSDGHVGIGTSTPLTDFHISKTAATGTITTVGVTVTGSGTNFLSAFNPGDYLAIDAGPATAQIASIESDTSLTLTAPLWFGNLTNPFPIKRVGAIFNNGNVGIGTTGPLSPLHVSRSDTFSTAVATFQNPAASSVVLIKGANTNDAGGILEFHRSSSPIARMQAANSTAGHYIRFAFYNGGTGQMDERLRITSLGNVGIGTSAPTARLHLAAGTTSLAPLKLTSGTLLSSPQSGTIEYDGSQLYFTDAANTRRALATTSNPGSFENTSSIANTSGNITLSPNETTGSVVVSATTAATNSNTGSLIVKGGLGVAGDIYSAATINGVSVTASSGLISPYIAGSVASGGTLTLDSTTHATKGNIFLAPNGGNVGIGTSAPTRTLHVKGSALFERDNAHPQVVMKVNGPLSGGTQEYSFDVVHNTGEFRLTDRTNGSTVPLRLDRGTPARIVLDASGSTTIQGGNVGIGTTSPQAKLDISRTLANDDWNALKISNVGSWSTASNKYAQMLFTDGTNNVAGIGATFDGTYGRIDFNGFYNGGSGSTSSVVMSIRGNGNVGIGTTTPAAKLEVAGATANCAAFGICVYENLAQSSNANQPVSGTLKISMPLSWNNTMMAVTISGYNYTSNTGAWEVVVGGYNWIAGNWVNTSVDVRGTPPFTSVRLAHDGTSNTILLGDTSTIWTYPKVAVTRMMATHGGAIKDWGSGWGISYITDETGISNVAQLTLRKVELANGNFGFGVLAPTARLHLAAGTSSNAPLKLTSGTLLSSPQSGTIEYDGSQLYFTDGANSRRAIATNSSAGSFDNTSSIANTSGNITLSPNNTTGGVVVSATTASANPNTGALVVKGGLGVAGNINTAADLNVSGASVIDGSLRLSSMTSGSVLFAGSNGVVSQDNANFFWDNLNKRLGLGTTAPSAKLHVHGVGGKDHGITVSSSGGNIPAVTLAAGANTPDAGSILFGDGTGWKFHIARRSDDGATKFVTVQSHNGNVGVGTTSPGTKLQVASGGVSTDSFYSFSSVQSVSSPYSVFISAPRGNNLGLFTSSAERLTVDSGGNVGIGKTDPTAPLEIGSLSSSNVGIKISNNSTPNLTLRIDSNQPVIESTASDFVMKTQGVNIFESNGGLAKIGNGVPSFPRGFYAKSLAAGYEAAIFQSTAGQTEDIIRVENSSANSLFEVTSDGKVGIGTSDPTEVLEVNGQIKDASGVINPYGLERSWAIFSGGGNTAYFLGYLRKNSGVDGGISFVITFPYDYGASRTGEVRGRFSQRTGSISGSWHKYGTFDSEPVYIQLIDTGSGNLEVWAFDTDFANSHIKAVVRHGSDWAKSGVLSAATAPAGTVIYDTRDLGTDNFLIGGNVGIGTATPTDRLHVMGVVTATSGTANISMIPEYLGSAYIQSYQSVGVFRPLKIDGLGVSFDAKGSNFHFANGNVGVGTNTPAQTFEVAGPWGFNNSSPATSGTSQNGIMRLGANSGANGEVVDFGFNVNTTSGYAWIQSTNRSNLAVTYNMALNPNGGNVGIGTSAPTQRLHVVGNLRVQGSTDCTLGDGAGGTNCSSDVRLKDNIKPIPYALDKVLSLKGVEFDWNQKSSSYGRHDIGVIAQDVEKVFPTAVVNDQTTGYKKVDYAVLVAPVIEAVKALYQRLIGVERSVASVAETKVDRAEFEALKAENAALKAYLCSKDPTAAICK